MPNNNEFLKALFGENAPWVHVTDFAFDPSNIPPDEHLRAWAGNYFSRYRFGQGTNQYFTISNFYCDEHGKARRRKALYWQTPVIVLDDVKEKLNLADVQKLPRPTWILETSAGSEQWGYLLNEPCKERAKVENLLDGLVANGLAPDGRDPGMKGVTRYVRLPDGVNTKANKLINGQPFRCRMLLWEPFNTVSLEQLAAPFAVDLDAARRDQRVDGAAEVSDHPLANIPEIIKIKEVRSAGRFDITCPWVQEHTGEIDNGAGIFTNADGTIGFKCHHGACQERTGADLLRWIETQRPGFNAQLTQWQANRAFSAVLGARNVPDFTIPVEAKSVPTPAPMIEIQAGERQGEMAQAALAALRHEIPGSIPQRQMASEFLKAVDGLKEIDRVHWHQQLRDVMRWNQKEFTSVLNALRTEWYDQEHTNENYWDDVIYIGELDEFFDRRKQIFYKPMAFQNNFAHLDSEARKQALEGKIKKVDKLDYAPRQPAIFERSGISYANSWQEYDEPLGAPGDVSRWLDHWDVMGWGAHRDHMLKWMAWTILHPETKINHMLLLGGAEGIGKDFLLYPLVHAMGSNSVTVPGEALTSQFSQYLLAIKYLHINEVSLADYREANSIGEKLKPLAAAPPEKLYIDIKKTKPIWISNIVNTTMCTNNTLPFKTKGLSRRLYGMWSDLNVRDRWGEMKPEWRRFWNDRWTWMNGEGAASCIYYLRNCVDLNSFNPAEAPPMTQFIRDINEASKSLLTQTIEAIIQTRKGPMSSDIVTANDITQAVKMAEIFWSHYAYVDSKTVTPTKVSNVMMNAQGIGRRDIPGEMGLNRYFVLRNTDRYQMLSNEEFMKEYRQQIRKAQFEQGVKGIVTKGDQNVSNQLQK